MAILTITLPSGTVYDYDTATTGIAGKRQDLRAIQSFNILVNDAADEWTLHVNHQIFIGRYATQAQAIGALFGCFIHSGADKVGFAAALENQIDSGISVIAGDGDNIRDTVFSNGQFGAKITNFNPSTFEGTATVAEQVNEMNLGYSGAVISTFSLNYPSPGLQQHTIDAKYGVTYESSIQAAIPSLNKAVLPDIVVDPLDVNISTNGVPVVGVPFTAETTLTNYDSRIPIQYKWEWREDPTGSNTLVLSETTSTGTSSYTPAVLGVSFRITVTCKYALGTHAGTSVNNGGVVEDSETTSVTRDSFSWIQGPEITLLSQDQYNISPALNTDYVGTDATFDYAWTREINGVTAPFGTNAATQVLSLEGVYESDVTGQNIINGITYSATADTRNSITVLPAAGVADIKLFTTLDPAGTEVTSPIAGETYYAYGFTAGDVYIPDVNMTWTTDLYDSSWMNQAPENEVFPSARWINADGEEASGTYKVGIFAKHIAGIAEVKIYARKHVASFTVQDHPSTGWDLVDTITTETTETYRGNSISGYWADWTAPASAQTAADIYKFKAVVTSIPYANYPTGSVRNLDGARYAEPPLSGDGVYNDMGLLRRTSWGSYGNAYGLISKKGARAPVGDGNPFNGEYLHSVTVGRPYLGDLYVDFDTGSDATGDGAVGNPYKTVTQAMFSNETAETSYDYILVDGDHRLATDIGFESTDWMNINQIVGGAYTYESGGHLPIIKAATPGGARIVGLCDANRDPVLTTGGVSTLYNTELQGIVFYADDELTGVWDGPGSATTFSTTSASIIMDGCTEEERWDYSAAPFNNPDAHRPSTTMDLRAKLGVFSYNHTMQNVGNGQGTTVAINHTYDNIIEDAVASQLGIDITVSRCDNARIPGYYYDFQIRGDLAWVDTAGTYSASLDNITDYTNTTVPAGPQVWLGLSLTNTGVLTLEVNGGEGDTVIRDFASFDIKANGNTYNVKTTGTFNTPGTTDVITWDASHRQNAMLLALYNDIVAEGTPAVDNFFRHGSPHPDFIQVYTAYNANDDLGNRVVDNYINSNCHAAGPNNAFQGLFFSDTNEYNACYFGDLTMNGNNNGTSLNAYGKSVPLVSMYWFSSVTGCLLERINATGGTYRIDGNGVATNTVMRDCGWVTYSTTSPDHGQDDSATNGKSAIDSFPGRNAQGDDWWYGSENYPEEVGYPAPGFMFPDLDGPNNNTGTPNAYMLAGGPSLSPGWTSTTAKTVRYEVTGSNGIPQQGPASSHWSASVTPLGWRVDPAFSGNLIVPGYSINVDAVPEAYSAPVPATVSWEWKLDNVGTGNTTATYSIVEADEGKELTCVFTATDGTGSPDLVTTSVLGVVAPLGGTGYEDYMTANAGVGYWEVPYGQGETAFVGPRTGGDASTTWTNGMIVPAASGSATTSSGIVVTLARRLTGPYNQLGNPYQYCAVAFQEASTQWNGTRVPGWVVCEVEAVPGGISSPYQTYIPIEGTDGMDPTAATGAAYVPGYMPPWTYSSPNSLDMLVFFFDGYASGAVQAWNVWDGSTLP